MKSYSRVYAEIDLDAVLHNIAQIQQRIGENTKILGVIKADGYGHGAVPIGRELEPLSMIWGYATATVEEALFCTMALSPLLSHLRGGWPLIFLAF